MKAFTIGRHNNNDYFINDSSVSGNHAEIIIDKDFETFTLKDLNSTNGTKVNGQSIVSKKIKPGNNFEFGLQTVNSNELFTKLKAFILKNRTDFSNEFNQLKDIEATYQKKKHNVNKYYKIKTSLVRLLITGGLLAIISQLKVLDSIENGRMYLMIGVGAIGGILSTISISDRKIKQKLEDLYISYSEDFNCPKCNFDMTSKSWKFWKSKKKCPKCSCTWVNENH